MSAFYEPSLKQFVNNSRTHEFCFTKTAKDSIEGLSNSKMALCILWSGVMDWRIGLESWSGVMEWILGVETWSENLSVTENSILVVKFVWGQSRPRKIHTSARIYE